MPNKTVFKFFDRYDGEIRYVKLDKNQKNLLDWLSENRFLREEVDYELSNLPEIEEI